MCWASLNISWNSGHLLKLKNPLRNFELGVDIDIWIYTENLERNGNGNNQEVEVSDGNYWKSSRSSFRASAAFSLLVSYSFVLFYFFLACSFVERTFVVLSKSLRSFCRNFGYCPLIAWTLLPSSAWVGREHTGETGNLSFPQSCYCQLSS